MSIFFYKGRFIDENTNMKEFIPKKLPLNEDLETKEILKATTLAHRALAELKGIANSLPNEKIIINSLVLQEAKDSSEIENIITTYDEVYRSDISSDFISQDIKEVQNYKDALYLGYEIIKDRKFISVNHIKEIQATLEQNDAGFRKQSGTVLKKKRIAKYAGYFQITLAIIGIVEVIRRFLGYEALPVFSTMIIVSVFALIANGICLYLLQKSKSQEAHMRASMIFTSNDIIINLGVITAGVLVNWLHSGIPDLIIGIIVFGLVIQGAFRILKLSK